ncbi:hypothetical protein KUV23_17530 [Algoriphagus marincola]|uniref:TolB-like 6-blade propeller-like n=1 Tax=Algoriphagus marincola TaxID=264027 RepID=A0ABS7N8Y1_9BACT|nr:hypothetical protein [Algoriphagus marincola]MBY5952787.1 hypothetical protein [Algoriphagus marincola]
MRVNIILFSILLGFLTACGKNENRELKNQSNIWELEIIDSIQVDYLGRIWNLSFKNDYGYLKDITTNSIVKFDTSGNIVAKKTYPDQGPFAVFWISSLTVSDEDELFASSYREVIHHFDKDLNLIERFEMPFLSESRGGRKNAKNIQLWRDKILLWYPGRDGISPYTPHFYRDYPLLELFDPKTLTSDSLVRIPPSSKFNSDLFFGSPTLQFSVKGDYLYLALSNDPQIHLYSLEEKGKWLESIPFNPTDFQLIPGQDEPVGYVSGNTMYEASINGIFTTENGFIVYYSGGIDEETFQQFELNKPENFPLYPQYRKNYLKIYQTNSGLSNEIVVPPFIEEILNIESIDKPFYALRNDEYLGEERDYLTFYKLQLNRK